MSQKKSTSLFDFADTFIGLSDALFDSKISKMLRPQKEDLYLRAKDEYYKGSPLMTDSQFDRLEETLKQEGSNVVNKVGGSDTINKNKLIHKHLSPMLSLEKIQVNDEDNFPVAELTSWNPGNIYPLEATPKFDGSSVELQYENGKLIMAVSRGDDGLGSDLTNKLKMLVPNTIATKHKLEIRGEVVMAVKIFKEKYLPLGRKNPRNMAAGILSNDEVTDSINDCIFIAYSIKAHKDGKVLFVEDAMSNLDKMGFNKKCPVMIRHINKPTDFWHVYKEFKSYRADQSEYQLDGIVFKMPENVRASIGQNNHHPKWAVALKFPSKEASTKIVNVEWKVGYTGELSPVGILHPVDLDGSTISKVSLYNKSKMEKMGMFPGAVVTIKKSGDIIPQIIKITSRSPKEAEFIAKQNYYPKQCPSCNHTLEIEQDSDTAHIMCNNYACSAKNVKKLALGVAALDMKGIGESICEDLYNSGVTNIFEFFDINKMNAQSLCRFGIFKPGRQLEIVLDTPKQLKKIDLYKVVLSLQFNSLGNTGSKEVAKMFAGQKYSFDGLEKVVVQPFLNPNSVQHLSVLKLLDILKKRGVTITKPQEISSDSITFEMTGSPAGSGYKTKEELVAFLATKNMAHTKLKDAKILLTDSYTSSSSKMKDASKKGVKIMTYEDLVKDLK